MKSWHWLVVIVAILALNNWWLISRLEQDNRRLVTGSVDEQQGKDKSAFIDERADASNRDGSNRALVAKSKDAVGQQSENVPFATSFERYADSKDFEEVMDNYIRLARERRSKLDLKIKSMTTSELFEQFQNSESTDEKMRIVQYLGEGKLNSLNTEQLKSIYLTPLDNSWMKGQILSKLLDKNDPQALEWAKAELSNPSKGRYSNHEIFDAVYDKEPEFITRLVERMTLEEFSDKRFSISAIFNRSELANIFMKNNLDGILNSDSTELLQMVHFGGELEMSREQQAKLLDLASANNRHKRAFAIRLIKNVNDINSLRASFDNLTRPRDKQSFVGSLASQPTSKEHKELAIAIIEESDDPMLKRMLPYVKP